ncbi:GEL complex subunit OPTI-like isoform X1 [Littorina saxatilis]|uniref:Rab5-interacting protein n=1 Tax=Littorina saxatilis TaxID=31220 RepID=A0AAN9BZ86_9CAEN
MPGFKPPENFDFRQPAGWQAWRERFARFRLASKLNKEDGDVQDEFLDVIYWLRQILGVILGLIWGLLPMKGILGIAIFFLVNVAIVYIYSSTFQKVDEEEYGGMGEILKEGLMTSFSSFLVCWIILYSSLHVEFSS